MLLLDEPLGALDLKLRRQMQIELKRIQTEVGITFVHVTHDQEEAMTMADTIAVMNHGVIEQMGAPAELYENPRDDVRGELPGSVQPGHGDGGGPPGDAVVVDCQGQKIEVERRGRTPRAPRPGSASARRRSRGHARRRRQHAGSNVLTGGKVSDVSFVGVSTQYLVAMPWGQELMVFEQNTGRQTPLRTATTVDLAWSPDHAFLLDAEQDAHAGMMTPEGDE